MPTTDLTAHDVLCAAKAKLMRDGWYQGGFGRPGGPLCLYGAVKEGGGIGVRDVPTASVFQAHRALIGLIEGDVAIWNDASGRTFEEVIALLDKAIWATAPKPNEAPTETPVEALA